MTTPASNTPSAIIADAYFDAGLTQLGETPNSEMLVVGMRKLMDVINLEQTQGLKLWLNVDTEVTLVEGQGTYTLSPTGDVVMTKPLRVLEAYYKDANGSRRPLNPLSWNDWVRLSQVTQTGQVNSYFVDKQQTVLSVFFWIIPDAVCATGTAHLLLQTQVTNFTNLTEEMNFPLEWRMFLRWALADELATGQPQAIMDRCQQRAATYREALEGWDVEDASTRFAPDTQSQYSSFR
tara:strand:- start:2889 stop:3596 length:708 start_codon:yes stop_codon:yes gene_type:complete